MKGKNFNDRLVLSPHYTKQIISLIRALCRSNTCVIVGPPGCGKQSALSFCAQMLGIVSHEMSLITIFGHKQFVQEFQEKFDIFHEKITTASDFRSYLVSYCKF